MSNARARASRALLVVAAALAVATGVAYAAIPEVRA